MNTYPVDPELIKALADILTEAGLTELEIEHKDGRIRLARTPAAVTMAAPAPVAPPAAPVVAQLNGSPPAEEPHAEGTIASPMVGVAYLSSEPGTAPFIAVGQTVTAGQTLLLIEAMKTYNQIRAPKAGTVMKILVGSGQPVEFGQPLLVLA